MTFWKKNMLIERGQCFLTDTHACRWQHQYFWILRSVMLKCLTKTVMYVFNNFSQTSCCVWIISILVIQSELVSYDEIWKISVSFGIAIKKQNVYIHSSGSMFCLLFSGHVTFLSFLHYCLLNFEYIAFQFVFYDIEHASVMSLMM